MRVTGLPGEPKENVIPGATVARLLEAAADDRIFDPERIGCELRGLAEIVGQLEDGGAGPYVLELALQSIARRVKAMRPGLPVDRYQVRATEGGR